MNKGYATNKAFNNIYKASASIREIVFLSQITRTQFYLLFLINLVGHLFHLYAVK